ncbi:IMS domain-containing protein [Acaryochloris sp. IP29b_bin.137]|uniref:IMS domain-containing protein n=1 Tax=Acaryochloris sp. IP29b_bin.137 TaxID=2969217 RepID=UPI00260AA6D3|nr:IMS domain-containing protein [Acaryochloris sp. IP29b_bin.137]
MRIPLDLYQILGVPIQSTPEQIEQAFADRCQQLPRQEYSKAAIAARTQLLQDAHAVLSDSNARTAYDESILAEPALSEVEGMELQENQLVGALLLLQEQSDYERIAQLGSAYLQRTIDLNRLPSSNGSTDEDVILAMALANMEAGRECWQQKQFEKASDVLQSGLKLLTQEQLFPSVQTEIEQDLYKLRPYRILELLAVPETDTAKRQQGFTLLQTMLDERGGIDGAQDDRSGLSVDDFLRFIQQLRCHLTVQEQQELFERETDRPSAVARYLWAYTLVARGCSQGQPEYIQQAKTTFTQLADRQDIHVEKSMCYLLLGQPGAAIQTLPLSRDQESLEFIHQYSEGSEDLVPGLFLYTERWLQQEVYPYFRDLAEVQVSLQNYFNDEHIQDYLNALAPEPVSPRMPAVTTSADLPLLAQQGRETLSSAKEGRLSAQKARRPVSRQQPSPHNTKPAIPNVTAFPSADKNSSPQQRPTKVRNGSTSSPTRAGASIADRDGNRSDVSNEAPQRTRRPRSQLQYRRWFFAAGAVALVLLALFGMISQCSRQDDPVSGADNPPSEPSAPSPASPDPIPSPASPSPTAPASPPVASPTPAPAATDAITTTSARQIIQSWQTAKAEAMGQDHQITSLDKILAEPSLSEWKAGAQSEQANQVYWTYSFDDLKINAIQQKSPTEATVEATVTETAKTFSAGDQQGTDVYKDDTYRVRYELVREQDQWKIKRMRVL